MKPCCHVTSGKYFCFIIIVLFCIIATPLDIKTGNPMNSLVLLWKIIFLLNISHKNNFSKIHGFSPTREIDILSSRFCTFPPHFVIIFAIKATC